MVQQFGGKGNVRNSKSKRNESNSTRNSISSQSPRVKIPLLHIKGQISVKLDESNSSKSDEYTTSEQESSNSEEETTSGACTEDNEESSEGNGGNPDEASSSEDDDDGYDDEEDTSTMEPEPNNDSVCVPHRTWHRSPLVHGTPGIEEGGGDSVGDASQVKTGRKRRRRPLTICVAHCKYDVVKNMAKKYSLLEVPENTAWNVYWTDYSISLERAMEMRRFQIINHFPGMNEICRKDLLARNLNRMKRVFPEDYNFYPPTWCLPADNNELQIYAAARRGKTYICKPEMGCQGRGIFLVRNTKDIAPMGRIICQVYIQKPFLIDHLKFDLRIYVLVTSCDPLRIWVFDEGLARFATAKYRLPTSHNTENSYMHLTNYAVNKFSKDYSTDADIGTKRKLSTVMDWLRNRGYDTEALDKDIDDAIIKTILSAQPTLKHHYRTCYPHHDVCSACFELLGFDILLDHKLKPYVIEVNHSPSFNIDTEVDREIKEELLDNTFAMLHLKVLDKSMIQREDRRRVQERITRHLNDTMKAQIEARKEKEAAAKADNDNSKTKGKRNKTPKSKPTKEEPEQNPEPDTTGKPRKTKEDYDQMAFEWETENRGHYRLIYPTDDTAKYDKFLAQNLVSLFQDTAASQARANLTKQKMDEYNQNKLIEEQRRLGINISPTGKDPSDRVCPESGKCTPSGAGQVRKPLTYRNRASILAINPPGTDKGFTTSHIIAKEECDRVRGLIQRGLLLRTLGVDVQIYQMLCKTGSLRKSEHEEFRRKYGFLIPPASALDGQSSTMVNQIQNGGSQQPHPLAMLLPNRPGTAINTTSTTLNSPRFLNQINNNNAKPGHPSSNLSYPRIANVNLNMNTVSPNDELVHFANRANAGLGVGTTHLRMIRRDPRLQVHNAIQKLKIAEKINK